MNSRCIQKHDKHDIFRCGMTNIPAKANEDTHCILPNKSNCAGFGVWDGHGGAFGSRLCAERFCGDVIAMQEYLLKKFESSPNKSTFAQMNDDIFDAIHCESVRRVSEKLGEEMRHQGKSGTTSVSLFLRPLPDGTVRAYCSNTGDSRIVWLKESNSIAMTEDHNLMLPREIKRIRERKSAEFWPLPANPYLLEINDDLASSNSRAKASQLYPSSERLANARKLLEFLSQFKGDESSRSAGGEKLLVSVKVPVGAASERDFPSSASGDDLDVTVHDEQRPLIAPIPMVSMNDGDDLDITVHDEHNAGKSAVVNEANAPKPPKSDSNSLKVEELLTQSGCGIWKGARSDGDPVMRFIQLLVAESQRILHAEKVIFFFAEDDDAPVSVSSETPPAMGMSSKQAPSEVSMPMPVGVGAALVSHCTGKKLVPACIVAMDLMGTKDLADAESAVSCLESLSLTMDFTTSASGSTPPKQPQEQEQQEAPIASGTSPTARRVRLSTKDMSSGWSGPPQPCPPSPQAGQGQGQGQGNVLKGGKDTNGDDERTGLISQDQGQTPTGTRRIGDSKPTQSDSEVTETSARAVLCVPLMDLKSKLALGVLQVIGPADAHTFTEADLKQLNTMCKATSKTMTTTSNLSRTNSQSSLQDPMETARPPMPVEDVGNKKQNPRKVSPLAPQAVEIDPTPIIHQNSFIANRTSRDGSIIGPLALFSRYNFSITMTRSLGDKYVARSCVCSPEITVVDIPKDEHARFVLASDGLWDVVTILKAQELTKDVGDPLEASKELAVKARVRREQAHIKIDDITCLVVDVHPEVSRFKSRGGGGGGGGSGGGGPARPGGEGVMAPTPGGCGCTIA